MFVGSRSYEDHQDFHNEVYKILYAMGVTLIKKDEMASYQLKDVAQTWYVQCRDYRS